MAASTVASFLSGGVASSTALATPTAAQIEELHVKHFRVGTQGLSIPAPQIEAVCAAMGDQDRYRDISEEGDGHIVYHALQAHSEGCPAEVLMEWWLVGQAVAKAQVACRRHLEGLPSGH